MLSKKMAFSLMRLITIFVLAFVVPAAMAADDFDATFSVINKQYGTDIVVTLTFAEEVALTTAERAFIIVHVEDKNGVRTALAVPATTDGTGQVGAGSTSEISIKDINAAVGGVQTDRKTFVFTIAAASTDADDRKVHLYIKAGVARLTPNEEKTSKAGALTVDLMGPIPVNTDRPNVVSIQRLRPSSQAVVSAFQEEKVTGAFDVRIVLTEKPDGGLKLDKIQVEGGIASNLVVGVPFARRANAQGDADSTILPHPSEGMYAHSGEADDGLAGVAPGADAMNVPMPTGTDNMYHQYRVTITPHHRVDMVKISIKEFHDGASPFPNVYKPFGVANKPNGREQLRLAVATTTTALGTGFVPSLPHGDDAKITDANGTAGHDIPVKDKAGSGIDSAAAEKATADADATAADASVMIPEEGQIYISEIMFARSKHGTLPQWIEISNGSRTEQVNLGGWTLTVENDAADVDVSIGAKAVFTIPEGTKIDPSGQNDTPSTVLVVTEQGRNNLDGWLADGQVVNLWTDQLYELILLGISKRRYSLMSGTAFKITLAPPVTAVFIGQAAARAAAMDVVGNLVSEDGTAMWALPIDEGGARSSIIRRHVPVSVGPAKPKDGEMMDSWVLASDTSFAQQMHLSAHSYYGLPTDVGTPGFRSGGALPVELSHFRPARDKATDAVVITWSTQSELNNAGFFIKRSQQRDGQFKVINAAMIPGAGTTSEKQFYTYTDTTAQPNVVYYYQIEKVSLDGNHQTLTRGIRLKGHVGAAGKEISTWGQLKTLR